MANSLFSGVWRAGLDLTHVVARTAGLDGTAEGASVRIPQPYVPKPYRRVPPVCMTPHFLTKQTLLESATFDIIEEGGCFRADPAAVRACTLPQGPTPSYDAAFSHKTL